MRDCPLPSRLGIKRISNLFAAVTSAKQEHELNSSFMAGQKSSQNRAHAPELFASAFISISVEHSPAWAARCDHKGNTRFDGPINRRQRRDGYIASAKTLDDESTRPVSNGEINKTAIGSCCEFDEINMFFQFIGSDILALNRPAHDDDPILVYDSKRAKIAAL